MWGKRNRWEDCKWVLQMSKQEITENETKLVVKWR